MPQPSMSSERATTRNRVVGISIGIALGIASLLTSGFTPVAVGAAAILAGMVFSLFRPSVGAIMIALLSTSITAIVAWLIADPSLGGAAIGIAAGAIYGLCMVIPPLIGTAIGARRAYLQRGWDLAAAEAARRDAVVMHAVVRERDDMASEIHDGLGHRLTLIAVQVGRLSLNEGLPGEIREELQTVRANAAAAAEELGETIALFGRRSQYTIRVGDRSVDDVIDRARESGMTIESTVDADIPTLASEYSRAAIQRTLQEGLTNAAKHSPGADVEVSIDLRGRDVVLQVRNPVTAQHPTGAAAGAGYGIAALRHRLGILGGSLSIDHGDRFVLTATVPLAARPSPVEHPPPLDADPAVADARAIRERRTATRLAWSIPAALLTVAAVSAVGYFVYATVASVLPQERFESISVGDGRDEVTLALPAVEMLDAPRTALAEQPGERCEFYEASVSFFERDDVFRICFLDDRVSSTDRIPAP